MFKVVLRLFVAVADPGEHPEQDVDPLLLEIYPSGQSEQLVSEL